MMGVRVDCYSEERQVTWLMSSEEGIDAGLSLVVAPG